MMVIHVGCDQLVEVPEKVGQAAHEGGSLRCGCVSSALEQQGHFAVEVFFSVFEKGLDFGSE